MPRVSLITPCYNSSRFLARTLESVRAQTLTDWEHVIVDDGSRDNSAQIAESFAATDARVCVLRQENAGVCNARNNGFRACLPESDYLLFLDADDVIEPTMLEVLSHYLDEHPQIGVAFCGFRFVDEEDRAVQMAIPSRWVPTRWGLRRLEDDEARTPWVSLLCGAPVYTPSLLRRSIFERAGGWDEKLGQHHEELDLFLRCARLSEVHYVPQTLWSYRRRAGQSSQQTHTFATQWRKVQDKWKPSRGAPIPGASDDERQLIEAAWRILEGRLNAMQRIEFARESVKKRQIFAAVRLLVGAALRYGRAFRLGDGAAMRRLLEF